MGRVGDTEWRGSTECGRMTVAQSCLRVSRMVSAKYLLVYCLSSSFVCCSAGGEQVLFSSECSDREQSPCFPAKAENQVQGPKPP